MGERASRTDPFRDPAPLVRRVYAYVSYRIGPGPDAEDVTSATFERALRYRGSFDSRKGSPSGWLIGIAQRCLADHVTGSNPGLELFEVEDPDDRIGGTPARLDLQRAVARLPERDRELVALRYGADLSSKEIGQVLDLRSNAVDVALHRALARLRETIDVGEGGAPPRRSRLRGRRPSPESAP